MKLFSKIILVLQNCTEYVLYFCEMLAEMQTGASCQR
jgi:hypothetical protein